MYKVLFKFCTSAFCFFFVCPCSYSITPLTSHELERDKKVVFSKSDERHLRLRTKKQSYEAQIIKIQRILGWEKDKSDNFCKGKFIRNSQLKEDPEIGRKSKKTIFSTSGAVSVKTYGWSEINQKFKVLQKGRVLTANRGRFFSGHQKGKQTVDFIKFNDGATFEDSKVRIFSEEAFFDIQKDFYSAGEILFRVCSKKNQCGWGEAASAIVESKKRHTYRKVFYTTCPPSGKECWKIYFKRLDVNLKENNVTGYGAIFYIKKIPFFYMPKISFPIGSGDHSRWLSPKVGMSRSMGGFISLPWYWNISDRYGWTMIPKLTYKRGLDFGNVFKIHSRYGEFSVNLNITPKDNSFHKFQKDLISQRSYYPEKYKPYFDALEKSSDFRYFLSLDNELSLTEKIKASFLLNRVSDAYYFQDHDTKFKRNINQLLNRFGLKYVGKNWQFEGIFEIYQTLHQINSPFKIQDQYRKLPELNLSGYFYDICSFDFGIDAQITNFAYSDFFSKKRPIGQRVHLRPAIIKNFGWSFGRVVPQLMLDTVVYHTKYSNISDKVNYEGRSIPIFDIDSLMFFSKKVVFQKTLYTQTLEPRVYFLYVPFREQNRYPNFDTYQDPFAFESLFNINEYSGIDRISNAKRVSVGITSRLLSGCENNEKAKIDIGIAYNFHSNLIPLHNKDIMTSERFSPFVSRISYNLKSNMSVSFSSVFNTDNLQFKNSLLNFSYVFSDNKNLKLGYFYVEADQDYNEVDYKNTSNVFFQSAFKLNDFFKSNVDFIYDLTNHHSKEITVGIKYDSCCWGAAVTCKREYIDYSFEKIGRAKITKKFRTGVYIELFLKGLME